MKNINKIISLLMLPTFLFSHGVSKSTVDAMANASLMDYLYFGAEHMVTGYDHILFPSEESEIRTELCLKLIFGSEKLYF